MDERKKKIWMGKRIMIALIRKYQKWISPLKGRTCRFYPTCSQYSLKAYELHGFWKGSALTIRRILKCHPFHPGGIDPVPGTEKNSKLHQQ
jgi:uncharacterized protein